MAEQQEEKKRKKYLLPVILLFAVCLVGAGFAYTAWTENGGNIPSSEYIELSQTGDGAYSFAPHTTVYYDTHNYWNTVANGAETKYIPSDTKYSFISGQDVVKLGDGFNIKTTKVTVSTDLYTNLTCAVSDTNLTPKPGWNVYLVFYEDTPAKKVVMMKKADGWYQGSSFTIKNNTFTIYNNSGTSYDPVPVQVYYGCATGGITTAPAKYPLAGSDSPPANGAILRFTVTTPEINPPGIQLSNSSLTATVDDGVTSLSATVMGGITGTIAWSCGDAAVTIANADKLTPTITISAAGSYTITATYATASDTYTATCVIIASAT
jgi:hypothetical protein